MSTLFDDHVARAIQGLGLGSNLLPVVEKEILQHDILREMQESGLLKKLSFFGGTCLRLCHGSNRLSEDLDFKGGRDFDRSILEKLPTVLVTGLSRKYRLEVTVKEPGQTRGNTESWTVQVMTHPGSKSLRQQRVDIDICRLTGFEKTPMLLSNHYGIDLGTTGLIINAQSRRESYTDKLVAIAFRNRIEGRDLWDLAWLKQGLGRAELLCLETKIIEQGKSADGFLSALTARLARISTDASTPNLLPFLINPHAS